MKFYKTKYGISNIGDKKYLQIKTKNVKCLFFKFVILNKLCLDILSNKYIIL